MSDHQRQTAFLKKVICYDDTEQRRQLEDRMLMAERDERVVRAAIWIVALLLGLSISGYCYSAIFVPEFPSNTAHPMFKICLALALCSVICLLTFLVAWFWYRAVLNKLREECRRFATAVLEERLEIQRTILFPMDIPPPDAPVYQKGTGAVVPEQSIRRAL
jgi:hypothetical protein